MGNLEIGSSPRIPDEILGGVAPQPRPGEDDSESRGDFFYSKTSWRDQGIGGAGTGSRPSFVFRQMMWRPSGFFGSLLLGLVSLLVLPLTVLFLLVFAICGAVLPLLYMAYRVFFGFWARR